MARFHVFALDDPAFPQPSVDELNEKLFVVLKAGALPDDPDTLWIPYSAVTGEALRNDLVHDQLVNYEVALELIDKGAFDRVGWLKFVPEASEAANDVVEVDAVEESSGSERVRCTDRLLAIAEEWHLFIGTGGEPFARVEDVGGREVHRIPSDALKGLLLDSYKVRTRQLASAQPVLDVLNFVAARALRHGGHEQVFVRVGRSGDRVYLDLGDASHAVIEVDASGWRKLPESPVNFFRPKGQQPLPEPRPGGSIADLRQLLNVERGNEFTLLVGWLLAALRGAGPYPVLVLVGEQGSAKSSAARILKQLVDPTVAPLRSLQPRERDVIVTAMGALVIAYDNVGALSEPMSDVICRLATGAGLANRMLYTDAEAVLFELARPVLMNGIEDFVTRGDLADRAFFVRFARIQEEDRRTETEINELFERLWPTLLGALLDAVSAALRNCSSTQLERLPRMADAARWVVAAEEALPWACGSFLEAYQRSQGTAVEVALESDPVAVAVLKLLETQDFDDTPTALYDLLGRQVSDEVKRAKNWPKAVNVLGGRLTRLAPALRQSGVVVEFSKGHTGRLVTLRKPSREPSESPRRRDPFST